MKMRNFTKMKGFIFLVLTLSLVTIIGAVYFVDAGIRYSYPDSFGTGIAVSENGFWIPYATPNLTIGQTQTVKYYIDNKVANTTANVRVTLKLDSEVIADYYTDITDSHTNTVSLDLSNLQCNSSHTLYLKILDSNDEDCSLGDNCAQRNIIVSCGKPAPICGDGNLSQNEQCDLGDKNGVLCSAEYNSNCNYCSDFCELKTVKGEFCGDGVLNEDYEECDDGNLMNGDKCSDECEKEFSVTVEEFKPIVWQCGERIMTDENVQPWRFSGTTQPLFERSNNYLFEGEKYSIDVVVFDKNKIQDVVVDLILGQGDEKTADEADFNINCVPTTLRQGQFADCNARIDEERILTFEPDTMEAYTCTITILDSEHMNGPYWLTVLAESGLTPGNSGVYDEITPLYINPIIELGIDGVFDFPDVRPGTVSYSHISITNKAEGGVVLDMFITGKDWPAVDSNLGRCMNVNDKSVGTGELVNSVSLGAFNNGEETGELVNYIPLGAFRYYAENGAFSTRDDLQTDNDDYDSSIHRNIDAEGYVNIHRQLNGGFEEAMFDEAEIIQDGGPVVDDGDTEYGYRANVLNPGSVMALTFRLDLPEPCYGEFESQQDGSIFIWGEAV